MNSIPDPIKTQLVDRPWLGVLTLGFATTVAMWTCAYVCRLPMIGAPGWLLGALFLVCLFAGGVVAGRRVSGIAVWAGARVGGLACLLNLLILGSYLADGRAQAATWVPGTLLLGALLGGLGAAVGRASAKTPPTPRRWSASFAQVAVFATLLLLALGGIVTGNDAGLTVPDWPNSFTSNMFVYPLSRMTGGIYYEHAHRLFGSLVGLTTLVLMIVLFVDDTRPRLHALGVVAFVLVVAQGVLGGLRVTGSLTTSTDPSILTPNLNLAVLHGITAQVFFGILVAIAAFTTNTWRTAPAPVAKGEAAEDMISGSTFLVGAVLVQLLLGALVRHLHWTVTWHVTVAVVVVVMALASGVRARTHAELPVLPKVGMGLMHVVGLQFLLGVFALAVTASEGSVIASAQVPVTTVHQTCGALVLGYAVLLRVWSQRVLDPTAPPEAPTPAPAPSTESQPV